MKIHVLANDVVYIDFTPGEHLAIAHSLYDLMSYIDPRDIPELLDVGAVTAYEFVNALSVAEQSGRSDGIEWLQADGCCGAVPIRIGPSPLSIVFTDDCSSWRLTFEQLEFIEQCVGIHSRRPYDLHAWSQRNRFRAAG
jgi:hypothetical protein